MDKDHVYMCSHIAPILSTAGTKSRLFLGPFLNSTRWLLILAEAFRSNDVTAWSTGLRSAT